MALTSRRLFILLIVLAAPVGCRETAIRGASGVCRSGETLLIAGDKDPAGYFKVGVRGQPGHLLILAPPITWVSIPYPDLAQDLEGIDILADGRVVVLSEKNHCLISTEGLVVQYDATMGEIAGRGLEGVAVRPGENGESMVAVIWEGGYSRPDQSLSPDIIDYFPMLPLLVVHPLDAGTTGMLHVLEEYPAIPLFVPTPEGDGPEAQRFRASDLVWHRLPDDSWGFIVLLTSENLAENPSYRHRWLQRFDMNGNVIGNPLDIEAGLPDEMLGLNWEGLDWFVEGKELILVYDDPEDGKSTEALVIQIPEGW